TLAPRDLDMTLRTIQAVEDELISREDAKAHDATLDRARDSILHAPSTNVADGIETATDRMTKALEAQNAAVVEEEEKPLSIARVLARAAGQDPDDPGS